ncbi:MAG TPA: N-acetylmuramic acid 6-phosphate etherase [Ktedonobacterales bacterium]|jgi:N-acetylmuramic acid 6-phosphate etherase|nr:N-acetylmuramic acid 6-phosphate etherase [Ktedonobacterales bacterium]
MPTQDESSRQAHPLESERVNAATLDIDRMSPLEIAQAMNAEDARVAGAVAGTLPQIALAIEQVAARMRQGGRMIYVGAGTSGRLGALDAAECPPTFNVSPDLIVSRIAGGTFAWTTAAEDAEDRADLGESDMAALDLGARDSVVGVTASGHTPYALAALAHARARGALTVGVACNLDTPLQRLSDIAITPIVGPEVINGSTRLKAGTAQKMVLNMLSTGVMIVLGKTYRNLMVDVQATNTKLRRRAVGIVSAATGLDDEEANRLLEACHGEIKTAIVAQLASTSADEARRRLQASQGIVRAALDTPS